MGDDWLENVLELDKRCYWLKNTVNIVKAIDLYTLFFKFFNFLHVFPIPIDLYTLKWLWKC